jgi:hypothetical protein|tara:strand:- start:10137 stop:10538 length:402 start_codon:yes stop_codon:yes gene_type:complete
MWNIRHLKHKNSIGLGNPQKGVKWEEWFIKKFGAVRPKRELNTPFDFFWNKEKIDLKICELYKRKLKRGKPTNSSGVWTFNRNGNGADFIICIGLINNKPFRYFKIPDSIFPKSGATIGLYKSKYDKFRFNPI